MDHSGIHIHADLVSVKAIIKTHIKITIKKRAIQEVHHSKPEKLN
jgi:hypothetical protein